MQHQMFLTVEYNFPFEFIAIYLLELELRNATMPFPKFSTSNKAEKKKQPKFKEHSTKNLRNS